MAVLEMFSPDAVTDAIIDSYRSHSNLNWRHIGESVLCDLTSE